MAPGERVGPRVFTVQSGAPFLPVLADALLSGRLVALGDDPLALAAVTVLLPTRRSVRALRDALIARLGGEAAILPVIRPIGDVDEEDHLLDPAAEAGGDPLALPAAIAPLSRRLALTRLTLAWAKALRRHPLRLKPDEPMLIPASAADATRLAGDLGRLIDDMETAGVPWDALATLAPEDHAEYFQLTLQFLKIVTVEWPQYLAKLGRVDPASRRDTLIRAAAARLEKHGSPGPIVAAGSTGSIPATAELLRVIARLPNGAVILPGLDQALEAAGWDAIGDGEEDTTTYGHPQFGLKQLIGKIGVAREDVPQLGPASPVAARTRLLSEAIRPAKTLDAWAGFALATGALDGLDLIVARNEQEEATAIALAVRKELERPDITAALVTPDRTLARRVAVELRRWGLVVDDSAGVPLGHEPHGVFARLVAEAAASDADPVKLLSLVKHRFASFGLSHEACGQAARTLEVALFRGRRVTGGIAGLAPALAKAREEAATSRYAPAARTQLTPSQWNLAADLVARIADCLAPLEASMHSGEKISAADAAGLLLAALRKAAADETGDDAALWQDTGGDALATLLAGLIADTEAKALMIAPGDLPYFLVALLADVSVQRPVGGDPRVHIWGTLEARLQSVDCLVLGGLDEGVWPTESRTDPWLSRAMRAAIKLPPPERRIGLAAHDFFQGMAAPRVIVSRAEKRGGAPTVESRWLQLLRALIGKDAAAEIAARGNEYVAFARALDIAPEKPTPVKRPEPRPPVAVRPVTLSITEIETLIRDPYAIYARHILKLQSLDPLGRSPDGGLRGSLIHDAIGKFTQGWTGAYDAAAEARLLEIGREVLAEIADFPDVHAVWSLRFAVIARWLAGWEAARDAGVLKRHAEISGKLAIDIPGGVFTLRGRADRIDLMRDGTVEIYDFKTGTPQTDKTVFVGLTPQMTLEAAMVRKGGFPDIPANVSVSNLAWLAIGKAGRDDPYVSATGRGGIPDDLADRALTMFTQLITAFTDESHPYGSRVRAMMEKDRYRSDYEHLARVREWTLVESEEDIAILRGSSP